MRRKNGGVAREPKKPKAHTKHHKKQQIQVGEHLFDSRDEARYYLKLEADPAVKEIVLHPEFTIIDSYEVVCYRCTGSGKLPSPKTGMPINCSLCKGKGKRKKGKSIYTADFKVTYIDGYEEIIDVKGSRKQGDNETFPLRKRLFESKYGVELIVMRSIKGEWRKD